MRSQLSSPFSGAFASPFIDEKSPGWMRGDSGGGSGIIPGDGTTPWENVIGSTVVGSGTITMPQYLHWGNGATFGSIPADTDGEFFFSPASSANSFSGGLTATPHMTQSEGTFAATDYNWTKGATLEVKNFSSQLANGLSVSIGDMLSIKRTGTTVEFLQNGVVKHTLNGQSTPELFGIFRTSYAVTLDGIAIVL